MSTMKTSSKLLSNTSTVYEDPESGELFIYLPEDLLSHLGWDENTELEWNEDNNGGWSLRKIVEVETDT